MNRLDKLISFLSPQIGFERAKFRAKENVVKKSKRSYDGATKTRRGDGWASANSQNQNQDIQRSLIDLRTRSIDGYKNNPNVFKAIRTIQNNVIGTGIMPTPLALPGDPKISDSELKKIKQAWEWFVKNCDFDEFFNFYGLQSLVMRNVAMQGEILVYKQRDASGVIPFKIQILSPHMMDHQRSGYLLSNRPDNYVVQGVEFDSRGRRVGFWIYEYNPNNEYVMRVSPKFVPTSDVLQVFYKEYPEQVRGIPFGTSTMLNMRDLSDYEDAQLMLQKISACHVAFTTKPVDADGISDGETEALSIDHLEPGLIEHLAPGEEVTFNNPPTPAGYGEYVAKNQQKNAAGFGITYEQLTGDMSKTNFTSGRMGWIEAQRQIEDWQYNFFIPQFCEKVWDWFIEGAVIKNIVKRKVTADWTPQGREMIDPVKEMNGLILELKTGLISWTEACKRRGYNPDVLFEQIQKDQKMFKDAGINVDWIIENVSANSLDSASGENKISVEDFKTMIDAYGVGVRSGSITPTPEDEDYFRTLAALPQMTEEVRQSWKEDGGFRRPITLAVPLDNKDFQA